MHARNESLAAARKSGAKRYIGLPCYKHPEGNGERIVSNRICLICQKEKMRARRAADPDYYRRVTRVAWKKWYPKNREKSRAKSRERATGFSAEVFKVLWELQGGCCAICRKDLKTAVAHADHCHDQKIPRGILCRSCNQAEGMIRKSGLSHEEFGKRFSEYIANPPALLLKK